MATGINCEAIASTSDDPVMAIVACLENPEAFDPNSELTITCNGKFTINTNGQSCVDEEGKEFGHCTTKDLNFCFDGKVVIDEGFSSNLNMMRILCTDNELPKPGPRKWTFGACMEENDLKFEEKGLRVEDKLSCYCQDHGDGLSWTCYDLTMPSSEE